MRRVMMLALLALALPTVALANSTFNFNTGAAFGGGISCCVIGHPATFTVAGAPPELGGTGITISFTTGIVTTSIEAPAPNCLPTEPVGLCFAWMSGGSVTVSHNGSAIFTAGPLSAGRGQEINIQFLPITLTFNTTSARGVVQLFNNCSCAVVTGTIVPEPSAFEGLLLGTGVLGLVEMARRKLRLET